MAMAIDIYAFKTVQDAWVFLNQDGPGRLGLK